MTYHCKHDGPSRGFITWHLLRYWDYSLLALTNVQDGPLWLWRSVVSFRSPTLGQIYPTSFSSHYLLTMVDPCGLSHSRRTVVRSVGGHFCNFISKSLRSPLDRFPGNNRKLHQKSIWNFFTHTLNLRKRYWKYHESTYINTLNLSSLFVLKRRTMTNYKIYVQH